jgi:hypothetical protein
MMNDARIGFRLVEALATLIVERRETRTDRSVEHQSTSEESHFVEAAEGL